METSLFVSARNSRFTVCNTIHRKVVRSRLPIGTMRRLDALYLEKIGAFNRPINCLLLYETNLVSRLSAFGIPPKCNVLNVSRTWFCAVPIR